MSKRIIPSYYAVFIDYGRRGIEAVVNPEMTRQNVIDCIKSGEFQNISFIHWISDGFVDVVTDELIDEAEALLKEEAAA